MARTLTDDLLGELVASGQLAAEPPPAPLGGGNLDRRAEQRRSVWRAALPDGRPVKITVAPGAAARAAALAEFARDCPKLLAPPVFSRTHPGGEALAEVFHEGVPLDAALAGPAEEKALALSAFAAARAALAATELPSTEAARQTEWRSWTERLTALAVWTPAESAALRDVVLPGLYPLLAVAAPASRWSNGDFLSTNLILSPDGGVRLIDTEHAVRTHFFAEDAVRVSALSPAAAREPGLFLGSAPDPGLPWHLFFWLRQVQLEGENNSPAYLERWLPLRRATLRRLAEWLLGTSLEGWSGPPLETTYGVEEARWLPVNSATLRISGWCHVPAATEVRAIVAYGGDRPVGRSAPVGRYDVQQHFHGDRRALLSGFRLATGPVRSDAVLDLCVVIEQGAVVPFHRLPAAALPKGAPHWEDYAAWAAANDPDPPPPAVPPSGPLLSVLVPVYRTPLPHLRACLDSVRAQHYPNWELCAVDDASCSAELAACLRDAAAAEPRIRVQTRTENGGISRATNDALAAARGEFVLLLDHDDLLRPHALAEIARALEREPEADVVYSDEDKITADGQRNLPFLKPDYSPEFLLRVMYVGHALCVRTALARAAGGFDPQFDGVQDYEFILRATARARRIVHLPRMLYHWRQLPTSSALVGNVKGDMDEKQAAAVRAHLRRTGRTEHVAARGGHRAELHPTRVPGVELVRPAAHEDTLAALRRAAAATSAEIVVVLAEEPRRGGEHWLRELAAVAERPDSGCVGPVLLAADGRVWDAGWTVGPAGARPLMRGFDPAGDGYNGSLSCTREVAAISPCCVAIRRDLALAALAAAPAHEGWLDFCLRLPALGVYHRICATAELELAVAWTAEAVLPAPRTLPAADGFLNPLFDPRRGDYELREALAPREPQWFLDTPPAPKLRGCLICRGWCFGAAGNPVRAVRFATGEWTLEAVIGLPRPDVRAALPGAPDDRTGFEIRGTLPAGRHRLHLEARTDDGAWHELAGFDVVVRPPRRPRWLGGDWAELMFFQMPAHMAYPPRPVSPENFPGPAGRPRPHFSIVTPSFQQAGFLAETMRSVLDQTGVACDYVVQDGGSTDGSAELIRRMAAHPASQPDAPDQQGAAPADAPTASGSEAGDLAESPPFSLRLLASGPRLAAWESAPDAGQADAIARGFARTSGAPTDLMAWINSDDFYLPGALAYVADYFAGHPEVDVIYGHRIVVDAQSREIARWFLPKHDAAVLRLNDFVPQETLFWRRRIWDKAGGIDPSFKFAMDWDLLLRFQDAGAKIVRLPHFLACFRVHLGQKTSAAMHDIGRKEIDRLRARANGREIPAAELERDPRLLRYLRRSAFIEFCWRMRKGK